MRVRVPMLTLAVLGVAMGVLLLQGGLARDGEPEGWRTRDDSEARAETEMLMDALHEMQRQAPATDFDQLQAQIEERQKYTERLVALGPEAQCRVQSVVREHWRDAATRSGACQWK